MKDDCSSFSESQHLLASEESTEVTDADETQLLDDADAFCSIEWNGEVEADDASCDSELTRGEDAAHRVGEMTLG